MTLCMWCKKETAAFVPAHRAGIIGHCPNCEQVLTKFIRTWPESLETEAYIDTVQTEDRNWLRLVKEATA